MGNLGNTSKGEEIIEKIGNTLKRKKKEVSKVLTKCNIICVCKKELCFFDGNSLTKIFSVEGNFQKFMNELVVLENNESFITFGWGKDREEEDVFEMQKWKIKDFSLVKTVNLEVPEMEKWMRINLRTSCCSVEDRTNQKFCVGWGTNLGVFDHNLKCISKYNLKKEVWKLCKFKDQVLVSLSNEHNNHLYLYDWKINELVHLRMQVGRGTRTYCNFCVFDEKESLVFMHEKLNVRLIRIKSLECDSLCHSRTSYWESTNRNIQRVKGTQYVVDCGERTDITIWSVTLHGAKSDWGVQSKTYKIFRTKTIESSKTYSFAMVPNTTIVNFSNIMTTEFYPDHNLYQFDLESEELLKEVKLSSYVCAVKVIDLETNFIDAEEENRRNLFLEEMDEEEDEELGRIFFLVTIKFQTSILSVPKFFVFGR